MSGYSIGVGLSKQERERFGYWLSGFVDGEGCFVLATGKLYRWQRHEARFMLSQRQDDIQVLKAVQGYFGCGTIYCKKVINRNFLNGHSMRKYYSKPIATYTICGTDKLYNILVPFFDQFPLRSRKAMDYKIWRQGVVLLHGVLHKPKHDQNGRTANKWNPIRHYCFSRLCERLQRVREYREEDTAGSNG